MIDDTLAISKCGTAAIEKNAILNSFLETQRLTMSKVLHCMWERNRNVKYHVPH